MDTKLEDLQLRPSLLRELNQTGYEVVEDMQHLPTAELLQIPWVSRTWLAEERQGLKREPFPNSKKH
ncbi:hypothetical protein CN225_27845 [Sinorhizobium meliloti]|nr:hypothetical protein [Sinorhizobium meliloti]RVG27278.1 hypothetical protein CN225_27845 [Sinorhizobium meliloti]